MNKRKHLSALAAVLLSGAMMLGVTAGAAVSAKEAPVKFDSNHVTLRFGVFTDEHFDGENTYTNGYKYVGKQMTAAIQFLKNKIGADHMPVMVMGGDLANWNGLSDVDLMYSYLKKSGLDGKKTELIVTPGNHDDWCTNGHEPKKDPLSRKKVFQDYNLFQERLHEYVYHDTKHTDARKLVKGYYHTTISGYHFLSVVGFDGDHGYEATNWLRRELTAIRKTKDRGKPVFIVTHCPPKDTVYGSFRNDRFASGTLGPVLKNFPEAVVLPGHTHSDADDPGCVWQQKDGYTVIHSGALCGALKEGTGEDELIEPEKHQFAMLEVDSNNNIRFHLYHLEPKGDSYVVEEYKNRQRDIHVNEPPEVSIPEISSKPDTSKPNTSRPEISSKPNTSKPDASKPDASKPDASKPEQSAQTEEPESSEESSEAVTEEETTVPETEESVQENESSDEQLPAEQNSAEESSQSKNSSGAVWSVIGIIAAVIVAGVAAFFLFRKKKNGNDEDEDA